MHWAWGGEEEGPDDAQALALSGQQTELPPAGLGGPGRADWGQSPGQVSLGHESES